jgi:ubiquinone/menaquinone biosynthesis C-methylase UbiE
VAETQITLPIEATWRGFYRCPLVDLGAGGDAMLAGVWSPLYREEDLAKFMSDHYKSAAGVQSQIGTVKLTDYYEPLLSRAFDRVGLDRRITMALELGCGFGSATLPLLKLCPEAFVVATELSAPMLAALKPKLAEKGHEKRCGLMQLDAERLEFNDACFDLVCGAAILHHLFHPERTLEQVARVLKPGGVAVFFEPFLPGYAILGLIYREIMAHWRFRFLRPKTRKYFAHTVWVWQQMEDQDKSHAFFQGTDDKWLFTRAYFFAEAARCGFRRCLVDALDKGGRPLASRAASHFSGNAVADDIRPWMQRIIDRYENALSPASRQEFLTEGTVIFEKVP